MKETLYLVGGFMSMATAVVSLAQTCQPYWTDLGERTAVLAGIHTFDSGQGPMLHGAGFNVNPMRRWDGRTWAPAGSGLAGQTVEGSLKVLNDGEGRRLYFLGINPDQTAFLKRLVGDAWEPAPIGMLILSYPLPGDVIIPHFSIDEGPAAGLYGVEWEYGVWEFTRNWVVRWNGRTWDRIGDVRSWEYPRFMFEHDFGEGVELVVSGNFLGIAGRRAPSMARWNGQRWLPVPPPPGTHSFFVPYSACHWDDGIHGLTLYVGFDGDHQATGIQREGIARWTGSGWESVGGGTKRAPDQPGGVRAMAVFDDGTGPALFVTGSFNMAGSTPARQIAKWDGQRWHALGWGLSGLPNHMAVANDGRGESLFIITADYAGGGRVWNIAQYVGCKGGQCYADCDNNHMLTANDFMCFLNAYAQNNPYANCDGSAASPVMTAADFQCYLNKYAQGCP